MAFGVGIAVAVAVGFVVPRPGGSLRGPYTSGSYLLAFGEYSHWLQPWRSYLLTVQERAR
jgi:hypothetical protein